MQGIYFVFNFKINADQQLLVEIGFFHGAMKKAFQGPMCRRMRFSVRFIGAKIKDCSQVLDVSSTNRDPQPASSHCVRSPGPGEYKCPPGESGFRTAISSLWAPVVSASILLA